MSNSRRRRNRSGNAKNGNSQNGTATNGNAKQKNQNQNKKKKKSNKNQKRSKSPKFDPVVYWGDEELLPEPRGYNVAIDDPTATVRSLGRPPIPGSESAAEHHFALIYERSANLAMALAAAGRLDQEVDESAEPEEAANDE